jgi:trimethylamine--corrinoid protein Co-methyltransferase
MLTSGRASIEAGLLGVDEVFSPVQMVLDDQLASSLCQFTKEYEVSDASIAAELVAHIGPGGGFVSEPHTASWFRRELWEPTLWDRRPFSAWHELDGLTDVDRARERALSALNAAAPTSAISVEEERRLRRIIERAAQDSARRH